MTRLLQGFLLLQRFKSSSVLDLGTSRDKVSKTTIKKKNISARAISLLRLLQFPSDCHSQAAQQECWLDYSEFSTYRPPNLYVENCKTESTSKTILCRASVNECQTKLEININQHAVNLNLFKGLLEVWSLGGGLFFHSWNSALIRDIKTGLWKRGGQKDKTTLNMKVKPSKRRSGRERISTDISSLEMKTNQTTLWSGQVSSAGQLHWKSGCYFAWCLFQHHCAPFGFSVVQAFLCLCEWHHGQRKPLFVMEVVRVSGRNTEASDFPAPQFITEGGTDNDLRTSWGSITHNDCVRLVRPRCPPQLLTLTTEGHKCFELSCEVTHTDGWGARGHAGKWFFLRARCQYLQTGMDHRVAQLKRR